MLGKREGSWSAELLFHFDQRHLVTVTTTFVVCVFPPPLAVMVMVRFPSEAFLFAVTVIVELPDPGAAIGDGENVTFTPPPCPVADKPIAELNPPERVVVIVEVADELRLTEMVPGDAETAKSPVTAGFTVSETDVVCVCPPPVPVIVML